MTNAFIPTGDGRNYVIVSPAVKEAASVGIGDWVEMRFKIADQDAVDIPEGLLEALKADADFRLAWNELTPGKKRGLSHHYASAKTDPTRLKRLNEIMDATTQYRGDIRAAIKARRDQS